MIPWKNPSPSQAEEQYSYNKNRYNDAAERKCISERQEQTYISEKKSANLKIDNLSSQKRSLEKRLEGVEKIIRMLEGTGGLFATNIPDAILKANNELNKADSSYRKSIKMSGGVSSASLEDAFHSMPVDDTLIQYYKAEKARIEQKIFDLKSQISALNILVSELNQKIKSCNATQSSMRSIMNTSSFEMAHYKKYMY